MPEPPLQLRMRDLWSVPWPGSYPHIRHRRLGRTRDRPGPIKWKGQAGNVTISAADGVLTRHTSLMSISLSGQPSLCDNAVRLYAGDGNKPGLVELRLGTQRIFRAEKVWFG